MTATAPFDPGSSSLILASASPRRRMLLTEYGYAAQIVPTNVEESSDPALTVPELVLLNAQLKSAALWARFPRAIILGSDTLVSLTGRALGKPPDLAAAAAMLSRLAGQTHTVFSGVCLACPVLGLMHCFVEETAVTFRPLDATQIEQYLTLVDPLDKAGAYAAQEHGDRIISALQGSATNVQGLPMERLGNALAHFFGIHPARQDVKEGDRHLPSPAR